MDCGATPWRSRAFDQQHPLSRLALGSSAASGQSPSRDRSPVASTAIGTAKYGHGIELLETFVDRDRFRGTCYRAAGWWHVGATTGRSRNDVDQTMRVPVKDIYLRPLSPDWRRRLCA